MCGRGVFLFKWVAKRIFSKGIVGEWISSIDLDIRDRDILFLVNFLPDGEALELVLSLARFRFQQLGDCFLDYLAIGDIDHRHPALAAGCDRQLVVGHQRDSTQGVDHQFMSHIHLGTIGVIGDTIDDLFE